MRAKREDRPILLSIGYSACHWCHVMEHESFEDPGTAAYMNEHFVPIKVDREERPDIDSIYMQAVQAMTGQGGWPLTVFLDPDGVPFYRRHLLPTRAPTRDAELPRGDGRSGRRVAHRRDEIELGRRSARSQGLEAGSRHPRSQEILSPRVLDDAERDARPAVRPDQRRVRRRAEVPARFRAGVPDAPDGRRAATQPKRARDRRAHARPDGERRHVRPGRRRVRALLGRRALADTALREDALRQRAARSRVPARLAADRTRRCSRDLHRDARLGARARCAPPREASTRPSTPTPRARRASSTSGPPTRYARCWAKTPSPLIRYWGLDAEPNFEDANVLHVAGDEIDPELLERARAKLYEARSERVWPGLDDKRLTAWNALMVSALADAGAVLERAGLRRGGAQVRGLPARHDARRAAAGCCAPTRTVAQR